MTRHNHNNHRLRRLQARIYDKKAKRRKLMLKQAHGDNSYDTDVKILRLTEKIQIMKTKIVSLRNPNTVIT
jgi:hypothetical protein